MNAEIKVIVMGATILEGKYVSQQAFDEKVAELEACIEKLKTNIMAFAAQLQAWGYDAAAEELKKEVLRGTVEAPDYYAQQIRIAELETMLSTTKQELAFWKGYALQANNHMFEVMHKGQQI